MGKLIHFTELNSTNTYLKENFAALADKTVVSADIQTAGRGRFNRQWISQKGGLYFSILLKPTQTDYIVNLTQLMALSICKAIEDLGAKPTIKWPNDVQLNGKKICGILSETITQQNGIACVIVGAGVNVAQRDVSYVGQPAISLREAGIFIDPDILLPSILNHFWQKYDQVLSQGFASLREEYKKRFPYLGKVISVKNGTADATGTVTDISAKGTLLLNADNGLEEILIGDLIV